eukprot:4621502-Amphidinium_carterae.1
MMLMFPSMTNGTVRTNSSDLWDGLTQQLRERLWLLGWEFAVLQTFARASSQRSKGCLAVPSSLGSSKLMALHNQAYLTQMLTTVPHPPSVSLPQNDRKL